METARIDSPRFRTDLVAQPIDEDGQRFVDVTDPDSGETFRFYDVEYSIACAMDGKRDIDGLIEYALVELGLEAGPAELSSVVATLADLGYLATAEAAEAAEAVVAAAEASPQLGDDMLDLGAAGGTPGEGAPVPQADFSAEPMELGDPGKSPLAGPRPEAPRAPSLELGHAGVVDGPDEPEIEMVAEPQDAVTTGGEMSFAGLLDADEAPTAVRDASRSQIDADEAPTMVRGDGGGAAAPPVDDFGDLEGLTPPPAEVPEPMLRPSTDASADEDGPTNLPPPQVHEFDDEDVSVDLSQHLSIDTEDVKEAVRASQVMAAVEVPPELLAEMEESEAAAAKAVAEAEKKPASVAAVGKAPPTKTKEPEPTELPAKKPAIKAAAASEAAEKAAEKTAEKAAAKSGGVSPVLWVLLIIAIIGGAAAYYFLVYKKDTATSARPKPGARLDKPVKPTPPPEPVQPTTKLAMTDAASVTVTMPVDSVLEWVAENGAEVEQGALVAKLKGLARLEGKLKNFKDRELHYQGKHDKSMARLEQAQAAGDAAATTRFEAEVARYKAKVEEKQRGAENVIESMKAATLAAPEGGTVEAIAKARAWVKSGDPVVKITTPATLHGIFTVAKDKSDEFVAGGRVEVGSKVAPDKMATCDVVEADGVEVKVVCPTGGALTRDLEVVLLKVVADQPEGEPEIEVDGEPEIDTPDDDEPADNQ